MLMGPGQPDEADVSLVAGYPVVRSSVAVVPPSVIDIIVVRSRTVVIAHVSGKDPVEPSRDTVDVIWVSARRIDGVVLARVCVRAAENRREGKCADGEVRRKSARTNDRKVGKGSVHTDQRLVRGIVTPVVPGDEKLRAVRFDSNG